VSRFVCKLRAKQPERVWHIEVQPGEEVQVDFGVGAPIEIADARPRRSWILRMVLSYSRKGYSEAVYRQDIETFLRCLENGLRAFGGVPLLLNLDNLKAAVLKADWLPKDAGGNIVPTGPPSSGRRTPIMTRRRSTFPAGQLADPDELQVEFERRVARLLIASSANFIPISAAWFVCDWSLFAKAGLRIVAVRHRINLPYEHPLSESPRKPTQTATTRQACQAS
jgi:Integrase core domain